MGTTAEVVVVGETTDALVDRAHGELDRLERVWDLSRADSEISRLNANASGGRPMRVTSATLTLIEAAVSAWYLTGGRFDPTVDGDRRRGCGEIELDTAASTVRMPPGVSFNPGGIGKGLAADLVVRMLRAEGAAGVCVRVGGEVRVQGHAPTGSAWRVPLIAPGVEPEHATTIDVTSGAVATTSALHPLVDPSTGDVTSTDVLSVSVVASQAWQAEALAKAIVVAGSATGLAMAERRGAAARVATHGGETRSTLSFRRFNAGRRDPSPSAG